MKPEDQLLKSPLRTFLFATKPWRKYLFLMYALIVVGEACAYSIPYFLRIIADRVVAENTGALAFSMFIGPIVGIGAVLLGQELFFRLGHFIERFVTVKVFDRITSSLYDLLIRQPAAYFEERLSGELNRRIEAVGEACKFYIESFPWEINWTVMASLVGAVLLSTAHPLLFFAYVAWLFFFLATSYPLLTWLNRGTQRAADRKADLSGVIVDTFGNIPVVHSFAAHDYEYSYYRRFMDTTVVAERKWRIASIANKSQQGISIALLGIGLVLLSTHLLVRGEISVGDFVLVSAVLPSIIGVIWNFGDIILRGIRHYGEFKNALQALNTDIPPVVAGARALGKTKEAAVSFSDISFGYPSAGAMVLEHFNLTLKPGERVGLVGRSGVGKSTIVKLLLRHYDPQKGMVSINGTPLSSLTLESLRRNIAFVPQDTALFHRSLFENILYARPDASREEIISASMRAHAHEFIEAYPYGYETKVGERGVKLSGGQRQRIAIARAMLKDAPILILDEATSSLDSESEEIVQEGLQNLFEGRTVLAIAHRLSTLRSMDRIIVLDDGAIVEDGSPQSLLKKKNGIFRTMWEHQKGGFVQE